MTKKELREFFTEDQQNEILEGLEYHGLELKDIETIYIYMRVEIV